MSVQARTIPAPAAAAPRRRPSGRGFPWAIVAPAVLLILLIGLFPLIYSAVVSFQKVTMLAEDTSFHGLENYARLVHDGRFWWSLLHTLVLAAIALPVEFVLGLALAYLFLDKVRGRQVFIALLLLPTVISPIVAGSMWRLMFDNRFGPVNQIIGWFAGHPVPVLWTATDNPVVVYAAILVCEVWQWTPFMFLVLLAALANVDQSQLEAAELDGAGFWRTFFRVVLPAIKPVVLVALTIRALDLVRIFDIVWVMTRGGPGTMSEPVSMYAYVQGFQQFDISYAAAMTFLLIAILSAIVMTALKRLEIGR